MNTKTNIATTTDNAFITIQLDEPLQRGDTLITEIQLRKPKAGELRGVSLVDVANLDVMALQKVLPRITTPTLSTMEVNNLDLADLMSLGAEVAYSGEEGGQEQGLPDCVENAMADIAVVFHWPLAAMAGLTLTELMDWRERAKFEAQRNNNAEQ